MNEDHIAQVRAWMAMHVELRMKHNMGDPDWYYLGMEDFLLKEGTVFREISPHQPIAKAGARNRYRIRIPQACFDNSYKAALASRGHLRYVEGYAYSRFLPVHHAWNIDSEGRVVDTTWCAENEDEAFMHRPEVGTAYIGVEFPLGFVRKMRTPQNTSVIDQWQKDWPVLKIPYTNSNLEVAA